MPGPLNGIKVLDLTVALAGPWCTHILGSLGAEIVKLEPISGDETRHAGPPFWNGESPLFLAANSNKRSVSVDLASDEGREIALRLASDCDVFVQNLRGGVAEKLGFGFEALREINPTIIYCALGAYGSVGPLAARPAYDMLIQAVGGVMSTTGEPGGRPLRNGPAVVDLGTGMWAAIGILGALLGERTQAHRVDTSLYEAAVNLQPIQFVQYAASGEVAPRLGASGNILVPFEMLPTRDGSIVVTAGNDRLFVKLSTALSLPELAVDPRFVDNQARVRNRLELAGILAERLKEHTTDEWVQTLTDAGVPAGTVKDIAEVVADPQFEALDIFPLVEHETVEDLHVLAPPISFDGIRLPLRQGAPLLGADTRAALLELGYEAVEIDDLASRGLINVTDVPERSGR